ncbi:MAG: DUF2318 domain-containing protein [Chloroflexi bacterium]|nr:DUF2318 domain-containing protein [Chloroflexota bacterium]
MTKSKIASRTDKRARFASNAGEKPRPSAQLLLIVAAVIIMGGGVFLIFMVSRPPASGAETAVLGAASVAATLGHDPYPEVAAEEGVVRLPVSALADGQARHYTYMNGDQPIEFFVLQSPDGTVRAAFNACDVCFPAKRGYVQDDDHMVCMNCGRRFPVDQIGLVQGGCNPAPLAGSVVADRLVIKVSDLVQGARFF